MALIRSTLASAIASTLLPNVDDYLAFSGLSGTPTCTSGNSTNHEMEMNNSVVLYNSTGYTTATCSSSWALTLYGIKEDGTVEAVTPNGLVGDISTYNYIIGYSAGARTLVLS